MACENLTIVTKFNLSKSYEVPNDFIQNEIQQKNR
jgi:hypothetical protein